MQRGGGNGIGRARRVATSEDGHPDGMKWSHPEADLPARRLRPPRELPGAAGAVHAGEWPERRALARLVTPQRSEHPPPRVAAPD